MASTDDFPFIITVQGCESHRHPGLVTTFERLHRDEGQGWASSARGRLGSKRGPGFEGIRSDRLAPVNRSTDLLPTYGTFDEYVYKERGISTF